MGLISQPGPGDLLDYTPSEQLKKSGMFVGYPQTTGSVLCDARHGSGDSAYGNKAVILQIAVPVRRGDPNSPAIVLKKRIRIKSVEFAVSFAAAAETRNLLVTPFVQATTSPEPNATIPGGEDGNNIGTRQTLLERNRRNGIVAKAVETVWPVQLCSGDQSQEADQVFDSRPDLDGRPRLCHCTR
jgi:hypothetical protein